jgi:hypothetical protein
MTVSYITDYEAPLSERRIRSQLNYFVQFITGAWKRESVRRPRLTGNVPAGAEWFFFGCFPPEKIIGMPRPACPRGAAVAGLTAPRRLAPTVVRSLHDVWRQQMPGEAAARA